MVFPDPMDFIRPALTWESRRKGPTRVLVPNVVDTGSRSSMEIAAALWGALGVPPEEREVKDAGRVFEAGVAAYLRSALPAIEPRPWRVEHPGQEMTFGGQYSYFRRVRNLVQGDVALRAAIGMDYLIEPDITVHLPRRFDSSGAPGRHPEPDADLLYASVSCKWSLRSDRAQNVRPEASALLRHRCGRPPHIVVVTAEPTIGRIASIAKGTGDLDAVYHLNLPALEQAMRDTGFSGQAEHLVELEGQGRLMDLARLPAVLAEW